MLAEILAQTVTAAEPSGLIKGIQGGLGCLGAGIGIGLIGCKAMESIGRNPAAAVKILGYSILFIALAEAVAFYAFVFPTK
jgi:F-type H+-transporting ATPase subunit c